MEEQKRLREEIAKRKSQRRQEAYGSSSGLADDAGGKKRRADRDGRGRDASYDRRRDEPRGRDAAAAAHDYRREPYRERHHDAHRSEMSSSSNAELLAPKLKPYLAVLVKNLRSLDAARQLVTTVGPAKVGSCLHSGCNAVSGALSHMRSIVVVAH